MKFSSRPSDPDLRPSRNFLYLTEQAIIGRYRSMVVRELMEYLGEDDKTSIRLTPLNALSVLHNSLGRSIRNEYELWIPQHEVTAIFHHCEKCHPLAAETPSLPKEIKIGDRMLTISETDVHIDNHPCHPDNFSMSCVRQLWETLQ